MPPNLALFWATNGQNLALSSRKWHKKNLIGENGGERKINPSANPDTGWSEPSKCHVLALLSNSLHAGLAWVIFHTCRIAHLVMCLTADPGVAGSIPAQSHTFAEIDHEIISTAILLPSADSRRVVCLFVCLFGLVLYIPVNSYGHVGTVSSPNHTFFSWVRLTKQLTRVVNLGTTTKLC